jgi:LmbE family N-acetylglucosaminyl deacetylase
VSVLIVVAHPDDEVLGCGATAALLAARGLTVRACILSGQAAARRERPELEELHGDMHRAQQVLGLGEPVLGDFPNIKLNTVAHLDLVQFIEAAMLESGADVIFTHHPSDLNDDHVQTSRACQAAARLSQRRNDVPPLKSLYFMEVLSATEWTFGAGGDQFRAEAFCEIGEEMLEKKIEALQCYRGVLRDYPHPRSRESVRALSTLRGSQAGVRFAEAFQAPFRLFTADEMD